MADIYLLIVTLLAATGWIFSKEALVGLPPLLFIATRFFLAGVIVAIFCIPALRRLSRQECLVSLKAGFLLAAGMACWIHGLHHNHHVGEGAFLTSMAVVLIPLVARFWFNETPSRGTWLALPVSLIGLGFLSLNNGFQFEPGQVYFLIAAILFAIQFNVNTQAVAKVGVLPLTAIQLMVVGVCSFILSCLTETWPSSISAPIWGWLLASAMIATSVRFLLQTYAQGMAPASHAAVILTIEPIWAALLAGFWFGEKMTLYQFIGCGCIFTALIISRWRWVVMLLKAPTPKSH
ncbi:MAG: EamA family transporter [Gammaproteobacteria bacterium]|nr:MAG: EamA family transporter [Gammaproteobacteria bacterium]